MITKANEDLVFQQIIESNYNKSNSYTYFLVGLVAQATILWLAYKSAIYIWRMASCPC